MKKHIIFAVVGLLLLVGYFIVYIISDHSNLISNVLLLVGSAFLALAYKDFNNIKIREGLRREIARKRAKTEGRKGE